MAPTQLVSENNRKVAYSGRGQKSSLGFTGETPMCLQSVGFLLEVDLFLNLFQLPEASSITGPTAISSITTLSRVAFSSFFLMSASIFTPFLTLTLTLPSYKNACDYIGPTWIIQETLLHLKLLNVITLGTSPLPYKVAHSQAQN